MGLTVYDCFMFELDMVLLPQLSKSVDRFIQRNIGSVLAL